MHHPVFYEFPEADPKTDRFIRKMENGSVTVAAVSDVSVAPATATVMAYGPV